MRHKFLSIVFLTLTSLNVWASDLSTSSIFFHTELGKCFEDTSSFLQKTLGKTSSSDKNISVTQKGSWTWVVDQTASTNFTWYLLETRNHKKCFRAFVPSAGNVEFKLRNGVFVLSAYIAPTVDLPGKLIELIQEKKSNKVFRPFQCFLLNSSTNTKSPKQKLISCEKIFD